MKVTNLGRIFPATAATDLGGGGGGIEGGDPDSGLFPPSGSVPIANGSNTWAWGSNVQLITVNQTTKVLGPFVNIANGSNTTVTVDQVGSVASNTIRIHATGGGGSLTVEEDGGTPTVNNVDHIVFAASGDATVDVVDDTGGQVTVTVGATAGAGSQARNGLPPATQGSLFDDFDVADTDPISGYTSFGNATTIDTDTTYPSHLYIKEQASGGSTNLDGLYKSWSASAGKYVEAWFSDVNIPLTSASNYLGLLAGNASGPYVMAGIGRYASTGDDRLVCFKYTNTTTFSAEYVGAGTIGIPWHPPFGVRLVYNSSTSWDMWFCTGGVGWRKVANFNPGVTPDVMGIILDASGGTDNVECWVDWINDG